MSRCTFAVTVFVAVISQLSTESASAKQRHGVIGRRLAGRFRQFAMFDQAAAGGAGVVQVAAQGSVASAETKVHALLRNAGIRKGSIPTGDVPADSLALRSIAIKWFAIQVSLERLLQEELELEARPSLFLTLKSTVDVQGKNTNSVVISHPGDEDVIRLLCQELDVDPSVFEHGLLPIGELGNFVDDDFKSEMFLGESLSLSKIQGAIRNVLQSDTELTRLAHSTNGALKPISFAGDLKNDSMYVTTEWQPLTGTNDVRVYWRARISLERLPEHSLRMESLIDFGERYRSQSFDQIETFTDSNRIGTLDWIDTVEPSEIPGAPKVRYKTFRPNSESLLTREAKELFGEVAAVMWDKVRSSTLKGRQP